MCAGRRAQDIGRIDVARLEVAATREAGEIVGRGAVVGGEPVGVAVGEKSGKGGAR